MLLVTCCDGEKTKSTSSLTDLDCTVRLDWSFRVVASPRGRRSIKRPQLTPSQLQGVWQNFTHFVLDDFSASPGAGIKIFDIFHKSVDYEVLDFIHV